MLYGGSRPGRLENDLRMSPSHSDYDSHNIRLSIGHLRIVDIDEIEIKNNP